MISPETFRRLPFFAGLNEAQLQRLAELASLVSYHPGEAVFIEARPAEALYVVLDGGLTLYHHATDTGESELRGAEAVYRLMEDGEAGTLLEEQAGPRQELIVGHIGPGEIAGLSAMIEPYRLTATARATGPTHLLRLDTVALRHQTEPDLPLAHHLLQAVARVTLDRLHFARVELLAR